MLKPSYFFVLSVACCHPQNIHWGKTLSLNLLYSICRNNVFLSHMARLYVSYSITLSHCHILTACTPEAVVRRCSVKRVFLNVLQNSQENTCASVLQSCSFYRTPLVAASCTRSESHKFRSCFSLMLSVQCILAHNDFIVSSIFIK